MTPDRNSQATAESSGTLHSTKGKIAEDQGGVAALPAHVAALKNTLLNFKRFVGLEATTLVLCDEFIFGEDEGNAIPLSAYKTDGSKESQRAWERELLEDARQLAEGARKLESSFAQDVEWQKLFRRVVTSRMDEVPSFSSYMPNTIEYAQSDGWDLVSHPSQSSFRDHKPDLCFGFPIYNGGDQKIERLRNSPSLQNFTSDLLSKLAKKGLRCTPVSGSHTKMAETGKNSTGLQSPTVYFPWCIMQQVAPTKESEDLELEMFRRVSIATSPALSMFEQLARFADIKQDGEHIQPVITITSVGSNTTLGLAYSEIIDAQYTDHKILSVWDGCISKIWDAIQLCRIVDNMLYWSKHVLRHKVSHYIDQWKVHYCPETPNIHSRLEEDPETAELVHRIQDRLSFLDISPSSNLIELIKQAVILQEVGKSDVRKTEPGPEYGPNPNAEDETEGSIIVSSQPSVDKSIMRESLEGLEKERERKDPESGEGEGEEKENGRGSSHGDKDQSNSGVSHSKSALELISPKKYASMATKSPVSYEKHTNEDSTAPTIDFSFSAVSSKPPTRKHASRQIKFYRGGYALRYTARHIPNNEPLFDLSRWMARHNLASVEEEALTSNNTITGKNFGLGSCSGTISSAPPNPFTAMHFEPRIDVKPWFAMMSREIPKRPKGVPFKELCYKESEPDPELSSKLPSGVLRVDPAGRFSRSDAIKRKALDDRPAGYSSSSATSTSYRSSSSRCEAAEREKVPEPLLPKKRIPYKDKFIFVRLPPPPPRKHPDLRPEDARFGM